MVFVTGGTGLLGAHLLRHLLQEGEKVMALYRDRYPLLLTAEEIDAIQWIKGDLFDVQLLEEVCSVCDEVYHCAGLVSFNPSRRKELMQVNVTGTANIVNACIAGKVKKLVHVSSVSALGRKRDGMTVTEESRWTQGNNLSNYGESKHYAEMEVWRGIGEGLKAAIVNPVIILGVGDWNDSSAATFKNAYQSFPWYTEGISGFVDAHDVVRAMYGLMKSEVSGERFILSAENLHYKAVFTSMAKHFSKKPPHRSVKPWMAALVWRIEKIKSMLKREEPLLTRETAETAQQKVYFDGTRIMRSLPGFTYTPIEKCIATSCAAYLQRLQHTTNA